MMLQYTFLIYENIDASHTCKNPSTFRLHKMNYFSLNVRLFLLLVGKVVVSWKINVYLHPPDYFMYNDEKNWLDILHTTMQGSIKIELVFDNIWITLRHNLESFIFILISA